jgi:hypothetical protein
MKYLFTTLASMMLVSFTVSAQKGTLSFEAGLTSPNDNFSDVDLGNIRSGNAGAGLFVGLNKSYALKKKGFSLFWGINALYNPYSKEAKDRIESGLANDEEVKFQSYINLPVSGGAEYRMVASPEVQVFGRAGLILDFMKRTKGIKTKVNQDDLINTHPISTGAGMFIGGGVTLKKGISLGLGYDMLGNHRVKGTWVRGSSSGHLNTLKLEVKVIKAYVAFPIGK